MRPQVILRRAADTFDVTLTDLTGPGRSRHLVRARFAVAWAIKRLCPALSLAEIGKVLGGRDHTTIVNALAQVETLMRHDEDYRAQCYALLRDDQATPTRAVRAPLPTPTGERWWSERAYWWPHTAPAA
jgi:chromosomal replication initiation ATPase DnaA